MSRLSHLRKMWDSADNAEFFSAAYCTVRIKALILRPLTLKKEANTSTAVHRPTFDLQPNNELTKTF